MKTKITYVFVFIFLFAFSGYAGVAVSDAARQLIEKQLVEKGLDADQVKRIIYDPRIDLNPDIVIKNLFYSSPKGSGEQPSVMKIDPALIEEGRGFMKENAGLLALVEQRFGASPRIITAILIIESRLGKYPMPYGAVTAYANLAFLLDPEYFKDIQSKYADQYPQINDKDVMARAQRRAKWALDELYHLAHIARDLAIDPLTIRGSFSGALGPAQFIPSTFRAYGIDGDNDGTCNPFNMTDAKLSMGNYLKKSGWSESASIEQKRKAVWHYNRSAVYVNTIMMLYDELQKPSPEPESPERPSY
ncbi:MAG: lytic murein transglycosylase [Deltaproteobacteria bacterium]|nr:lytic murein transglycosylase [Deltaproteobacteria bacterium]